MTMFRVGPAGIPASLKTDMDAVLNKKFGTSTTYAPNTWPDNVNLLGPLPEKTASGAIAHIEDGADSVPLKAWEVTVPANLSGVSSLQCKQAGKNILPNTAQTATENDVTFTVNSDGSVSLSGTCTADTNFYIYSGFTFPKLGQYFFSGCPAGGSTSTYRVFLTNYGADVGNGYLLNVSNLSTTTSIRINIKSGVVTDGLVFKPQIEAGSTGSAYAPYEAPTVSSVSLGRTIYGGTADVVTGEGSDKYGYIVFNGSENWGAYPSYNGYYIGVSDMKSGTRQDGVCNHLTCSKTNAQGQTNAFWLGVGNKNLYVIGVYDSMGSTLEAFKAYLAENPLIVVYPLATETDFTFTPITPTPETPLGVSNWWADEGDSDVTYRADINMLLNP